MERNGLGFPSFLIHLDYVFPLKFTKRKIQLVHPKFYLQVGFNYNIELVEDNNYGAKNLTTGEWNGLVRVSAIVIYHSYITNNKDMFDLQSYTENTFPPTSIMNIALKMCTEYIRDQLALRI